MAQIDQWTTTLPGEEPEDESGKKAAFAVELLKTPVDPFRAALAVFATNTNKALRVANEWPTDSFVMAEIKRLKEEEGELSFLPSKADLARSLWERAHSASTENDDFTKMARLYAEIMDFVPKVSKIEANVKTASTIQVVASPLDEQL
jgi:tRNA-dihydrouridine synthase